MVRGVAQQCLAHATAGGRASSSALVRRLGKDGNTHTLPYQTRPANPLTAVVTIYSAGWTEAVGDRTGNFKSIGLAITPRQRPLHPNKLKTPELIMTESHLRAYLRVASKPRPASCLWPSYNVK